MENVLSIECSIVTNDATGKEIVIVVRLDIRSSNRRDKITRKYIYQIALLKRYFSQWWETKYTNFTFIGLQFGRHLLDTKIIERIWEIYFLGLTIN